VTRKNWRKKELVDAWDGAKGICHRCHKEITSPTGKTAQYGIDWHMGHVAKAHWAGGEVCAPEHVHCNMEDARQQTKLAAKSVRIRANAIGVRSKHKVPSRPKAQRKKTAWWCQIGEETPLEDNDA
jgi:hypothetical protein